ncbi:aminopeptidase [Marinilongibacter aquaticus]|uniref:aminopeptidase n=1 Tax=Marinilongibacter aquaticus TaxID=2975157 RepID=UPI0021BDE302|nr:aminopeptidase [Marinilongibacter aquaticus]UBM58941.1 aminopeptidase [Marinilongibacter aquaticus]
MRYWIKRFGLFLFLALLMYYVFNFRVINYGFQQLLGQVRVLTHTVPVEEVLGNPNYPDSLKANILLIEEIKAFTVSELGLRPSGSYRRFYDQHGKPIIWVITACPPYALEPKTWDFPLLGEFSYKGFFNENEAQKEAEELKEEGYDVKVGEISAWSTLGYLDDPILSSFLYRSKGELAALIIHELTHGTLFVKNDLEFNENLADFVGDEGAKLFLKEKFGFDSPEYKQYVENKAFNEAYSAIMIDGSHELNTLFQTFSDKMSSNLKDSLKYQLIDKIMQRTDRLPFRRRVLHGRKRGDINNAFFTAYATYRSKQSFFKEELDKKFNGDFERYLTFLKTKYNSLGK